MKKSVLKKYAMLAAKIGVNVQKDQDVLIYASFDQPDFIAYVVEACYKCGARHVKVEWDNTSEIKKIVYKYETVDTLAEVPNWSIERLKYFIEKNPARIYILSDDPDGLNGVDLKKIAAAKRKQFPIIKPYRDEMENKYQWTIIGVPSVAWAKKVFPSVPKNIAVEKLWEAILKTARVTDDPIKEWQKHNDFLQSRCDYLNSLDIDYLHYESSNGTNLKVWLNENCNWLGGGETSLRGVYYNPNMPTEECFTTPYKGRAEGIVYSSKPLSYQGQLIENFSITFHDGKATDCKAEKNEDLLKEMINMDEGSCYLGECALVPFDSPVNKTGILFYNTLYDENATCHLALGMGFSDCVKNYQNYKKEDFSKMGINDSMIHEDFMIGTSDLKITGITKDGKEILIFINGNWAF